MYLGKIAKKKTFKSIHLGPIAPMATTLRDPNHPPPLPLKKSSRINQNLSLFASFIWVVVNNIWVGGVNNDIFSWMAQFYINWPKK